MSKKETGVPYSPESKCPHCGSIEFHYFGTKPVAGRFGSDGSYPDPSKNPPVYKCSKCEELFWMNK